MGRKIIGFKTILFNIYKAVDSTRPNSLQNPNLSKTLTNTSITLPLYESRKREKKRVKEALKAQKVDRITEINKELRRIAFEYIYYKNIGYDEYKSLAKKLHIERYELTRGAAKNAESAKKRKKKIKKIMEKEGTILRFECIRKSVNDMYSKKSDVEEKYGVVLVGEQWFVGWRPDPLSRDWVRLLGHGFLGEHERGFWGWEEVQGVGDGVSLREVWG
ncbi:hypothetical protein OCU04_000267 [Sclerotinia nivalis]|uniref:Uncharacterized protein n=1 Tax=Sclerotinia nivalis TaxID=352851 RepID=A0A9X0AZ43_9HELO|nr:hypothetical protein OCU04_000267 [Sclerotinia nivalis]